MEISIIFIFSKVECKKLILGEKRLSCRKVSSSTGGKVSFVIKLVLLLAKDCQAIWIKQICTCGMNITCQIYQSHIFSFMNIDKNDSSLCCEYLLGLHEL